MAFRIILVLSHLREVSSCRTKLIFQANLLAQKKPHSFLWTASRNLNQKSIKEDLSVQVIECVLYYEMPARPVAQSGQLLRAAQVCYRASSSWPLIFPASLSLIFQNHHDENTNIGNCAKRKEDFIQGHTPFPRRCPSWDLLAHKYSNTQREI